MSWYMLNKGKLNMQCTVSFMEDNVAQQMRGSVFHCELLWLTYEY